MQEDKIRWNLRYQSDGMPTQTSDLLLRFENILPKNGKALDIACGNGRNLNFLAKKGLQCEGVDISEVALSKVVKDENIKTFCLDLDTHKLKESYYDVILNFYYLNRDILKQTCKALKKGGVLLLETFIEDEAYPTTIESKKILKRGELESFFRDFEILCHEFKIITRDKNFEEAKVVSFVAKKC